MWYKMLLRQELHVMWSEIPRIFEVVRLVKKQEFREANVLFEVSDLSKCGGSDVSTVCIIT